MRTPLKSFAVITMAGLASVCLCQPAPKYSLSISLREITVKAGTPVVLDITTKNISGQEIMAGTIVGSAESAFDITLTDSDGNPTLETRYGRKIHDKEPRGNLLDTHSEMVVHLKPGDTTQELIYLSGIYDLTHPGKYIVQLSRTVYANDAAVNSGVKTIIESNSVTLTVTN